MNDVKVIPKREHPGLLISYILIIMASAGMIVVLYNINEDVYSYAINIGIYYPALFAQVFVMLGFFNRFRKEMKLRTVVLHAAVLAGLMVLFWTTKPKYTYDQAVNKIKTEKSAVIVPMKLRMQTSTPSTGLFVDRVYLINILEDSKQVTYWFNPVGGEYSRLEK